MLYFSYTGANTLLEFNETTLRLKHPFKEWTGPWTSVRRAYLSYKTINIQVTDSIWGTWHLRTESRSLPLVEEIKRLVPAGVWLDEKEALNHIRKQLIPIIILGVSVIVLMMLFAIIPLLWKMLLR